jgi:uncharacterized protein YjiS (DUF1127 family)
MTLHDRMAHLGLDLVFSRVLERRHAEIVDTIATGLSAANRHSIRVADTLSGWRDRAQQRRTLSGLDSHLLKDFGASSADAERESSKRFWRA